MRRAVRAISGVVRSRQCAHPSAIAGFSGFVPVNPVSSSSAPAAVRAIASSAPAFGDAPRPTRLPFKNLSQEDVKFFRDTVGVNTIEDADQLSSYNSDWMGVWSGDAPLVLRPRTTEEISQILKYCNDNALAVVPQGGNTGMVGGGVPVFDEVILSTRLMNNVISFDEDSGVLVCEAGCVLEELDNWLRERDHIMPLDLGAKGSCQIGGNVSTNAGGLRYIRYGSLHGNVLGLEVVLPNGEVLDLLSKLRKDNVGPDLKQLFIGAEGTLGVVTKVALQVPRKPAAVQVSMFACDDFDAVRQILGKAKKMLGEILSAIEFTDAEGLDLTIEYLKETHPLDSTSPFYVVVETAGSNEEHDREKLHQFLETLMEEGLVSDGVVSQDDTQALRLWEMREQIATAFNAAGTMYAYDLSLPLVHMYELVEELRKRLAASDLGYEPAVSGFGHLGDSNLHITVTTPTGAPSILPIMEPFLFEWTAKRGGSISAEHGVGQCKRQYVPLQRSELFTDLCTQMKNVFDPKSIMNPYKGVTTSS